MDSSRVAKLKQKYRESLTEKRQTILSFFEDGHTIDSQSYQDMYAYLHRFAGSAGMYGFDNLTQQARLVMNNIKLNSAEQVNKEAQALSKMLGDEIAS